MKKQLLRFILFSFIFLLFNKIALSSSQNIADTIMANHYFKRGRIIFYKHPDSCRYLLKKAGNLYHSHNLKKKEELVYNILGINYSLNGMIDSAEYYTRKSIEINESLLDSLGLSMNLNNLGLMLLHNSKYMEGATTLIKCLKIKEKLVTPALKKQLDISSTLHNIGIAFHKINDLEKSHLYLQMALKRQHKDSITNATAIDGLLNDLAMLYYDMKAYDKAEKIYKKLIEKNAFEEDVPNKAKLYNNYGSLLNQLKDYEEAKKYAQQAYMINMTLDNKLSSAKSLNLLAELSFSQQQYTFCSDYAEKAYKIGKKNHYLGIRKHAAEIITKANEQLKNYKKALAFKKIESSLSDSLFKTSESRIIREMETKYNSEKTQQENKLLDAQNKINELKIKKKDVRNTFLTITLFALLSGLIILSVLAYKNYVQRKLLKTKNEELNFLNQQMEKMFAIISHDMRGFVGGFKGVSSLIPYYIEQGKTENLIRLTKLLSEKTADIEELLNSLLEWAVTQSGFYKTNPTVLPVKEIVDTQINLMSDFLTSNQVIIENKIPEEATILFDKNSFVFIVRNLLSNSIKFTKSGYIRFSLKEDKTKLTFSISDTGIGMPQEVANKLFNMKNVKSMYSERKEGGGLGLKLVKDFVDINNGVIFAESEPNQGMSFHIQLNNHHENICR